MPYPFAAAEVLTAANLNAMIGAPTQNNQTGTTYSLALLDAGKTVTLSNASAVTVTLPAQATVAWIANTQINLLNLGVGTVTIAGAGGVTINGTPLTLATSKGGSLIRTASNTWTFVPFSSGGVDNADFSNTATSSGSGFKAFQFTGSGTLTVTKTGKATVLVLAGGGTSGAPGNFSGGGGGAGGYIEMDYLLEVGTYTATVGGAGSDSLLTLGTASKRPGLVARAGGGGGNGDGGGGPGGGGTGGCGGGGGYGGAHGAAGVALYSGAQGFNGSIGNIGRGGGAGAAGTTAANGVDSAITGTTVTRARGGASGVPNTANLGNGGAGSSTAGGSGTIIVRVSV